MDHRIRGMRVACAVTAVVISSAVVAACGSSGSGGDAGALLRAAFSGSHTVNSGNLNLSLTVSPSGSRTLTGPIRLSFGGPFQSRGKGTLPASDFNITVRALGKTGSIGIVSTGTSGYVTLQGTSYQLPAATFQKLESGFAQVAASPAGGANGGTLARLGIDPLRWLVDPTVVGHESIAGTEATHIHASVNVAALLQDVNTFLAKASSSGLTGSAQIPDGISAATRSRVASEVKDLTFDVWTGVSDKTIRRLSVQLTLPVSGETSSLLGGLSSAQIALNMQYANLNQPQTIQAPSPVRPFSEFSSRLRSFLATVQGTVTAGGSIQGASATVADLQHYTQCVQAAGGAPGKMRRCAALLNGK